MRIHTKCFKLVTHLYLSPKFKCFKLYLSNVRCYCVVLRSGANFSLCERERGEKCLQNFCLEAICEDTTFNT